MSKSIGDAELTLDGHDLTEKEIRIIKGEICPYCGRETELIDSALIYNGVSYGWAYICRQCNAYVGCYKGTQKAMGRLADEELRRCKHQAHELFDQIWERKLMSRREAYTWLSQQLGTERDLTHIGMFDVDLCEKVIEVCSCYLRESKSICTDNLPDIQK